MSDLFYKKHDIVGDDDESDTRQYLARPHSPRSLSVSGFYENQKCSYPTISRVAKDYLSMMLMSAPSVSLFSQVKNIVTDNRNRLDATKIRILAIIKARGLIRDELRIIADSFQDMQVNMDANQDILVADYTTAADDAAQAGNASSAQSSAASNDEDCILVSSDDK